MAQYRKKPIVVEAEQWFPDKPVDGVYGQFENQRRCIACLPEGSYQIDGPSVITIHRQVAKVEPGDWIITEPDGIHHYPCKPAIFEATYERVPVTAPVAVLSTARDWDWD